MPTLAAEGKHAERARAMRLRRGMADDLKARFATVETSLAREPDGAYTAMARAVGITTAQANQAATRLAALATAEGITLTTERT